jgi:Rrf2 family protein
MRISRRGEYALRAMIHLSRNYRKGAVRIHEISEKERIPEKFLEQILLSLRKAGILQSRRGMGGGYSLGRHPREITLARVIRIIDGPLAPLGCTSTWAHVSCPEEKGCGLHRVMLEVRNAIAGILEGVTFADLGEGANRARRERPAPRGKMKRIKRGEGRHRCVRGC